MKPEGTLRGEPLCPVGTLTKSHALRGEVVCQWDDAALARCIGDHLLLLVDGIHTPFFIAQRRERSATTSILRLDDIDTPEAAAPLIGCRIFIEQRAIEAAMDSDDTPPVRLLIGFTVSDTRSGIVGELVDIDDQTPNLLFIVETPSGEELLIPAHPDLIDSIDPATRLIAMHLPDGLMQKEE